MGRSEQGSNWMSTGIWLALAGGAVLLSTRHGDVQRDTYASFKDCQRDWQEHARDCEEQRTPHGTSVFLGPRYETGYRPATGFSQLRTGSTVVTRAGFGGSGARFGAGS